MTLLDRLKTAYDSYDDAVRVSVVEKDNRGEIGNYDFDLADMRDLLEESRNEIIRLKRYCGEM